jgi:hypothetical protein
VSVHDLNLERLQRFLPQAAELLARLDETEWSGRCLSAAQDARAGLIDFVPQLWAFFAPTCDWDDLTLRCGDEALQIGNEVFGALDALAKQYHLRPK